jgi:hypothetical protein
MKMPSKRYRLMEIEQIIAQLRASKVGTPSPSIDANIRAMEKERQKILAEPEENS